MHPKKAEMPKTRPSRIELVWESERLQARLNEAEQTLRAIQTGEADAIVVSGSEGERVFTLAGADQFYRTLVETMNEGTLTLLPGGVVGYSNSTFAEWVKTPLEQVVGSSFTKYLPEDQVPAFNSLLNFSRNVRQRAEFGLLAADASSIPALISARCLDGSSMGGFCLVITDLTAQKQREDQFAQLAAIVESSDDAIASIDLDRKIMSWNHGAERLYDYTKDEVIGRPVSVLVPVEQACAWDHLIDRVVQGEGIERFETVRVRRDGRGVCVALTISPIKNSAGAITGVSAIGRDITERKQAEDALARRSEELAHSNAQLEQFAYVASHDLQEPLRTVTSFTQLLEKRYRGKLDRDADEFIQFIVDGAARMQGLISGLLAYSRVGSRGKELVTSECTTALQEAIENLRAAIADSNAIITHDALPTVKCDISQIAQVFQNLLSNAIKFRGDGAPRVHVGVERRLAEWIFSVADNGIGIDPQYAARIFEIFQRLHTHTQYPGSGIGLAITRKMIERHGGKIWVESQPQQGATFFFTLPL